MHPSAPLMLAGRGPGSAGRDPSWWQPVTGPWSVRHAGAGRDRVAPDVSAGKDVAAGRDGRPARPAVEIYVAGHLADVVVATPIAPQILRGARRATWDGGDLTLAWGRRPAGGSGVVVTFARGRLRPRSQAARVIEVTSWCWLALLNGPYGRVTVADCGSGERWSIRVGNIW